MAADSRLGERILAEWRLQRYERRIMAAVKRALAVHLERTLTAVRGTLTASGVGWISQLRMAGLVAAGAPVDPFDANTWTDTLGRELEPTLRSVFAEISEQTAAGFFNDPTAYPPVDLTHQLDRMLGHMSGLGPEMSERLGAELTEGFNRGEGWTDLERRVRDTFGVGERRAERIARTETVGAANGAAYDTAKVLHEGGIALEKEWLATRDKRTRASHRRADGTRVAIDAVFQVGDCELERPHDPSVLSCPQEIVNCRCTLVFPEVEEGAEPAPAGAPDPRELLRQVDRSKASAMYDQQRPTMDQTYAGWVQEVDSAGIGSAMRDQREAITQYTSNLFRPLNDALRKGLRKSEMDPKLVSIHEGLEAAMRASPNPSEPIVVFRGMYAPDGEDPGEWAKRTFSRGSTAEIKGWTSASISYRTPLGFTQTDQIMLEIVAKDGAWVGPLSVHKQEAEFLLPHGSKFEVIGVRRRKYHEEGSMYPEGDYRWTVQLRQL